MYRRYYFGLTEEVHRGELRALREPARRNSGAVIAPARRENTRFSFHCYSDPITKQAKNWLGGKLDASKRSQIMFMDREDILNLYIVGNVPLPKGALHSMLAWQDTETPF